MSWKNKIARHLAHAGGTTAIFMGFNWVNELLFIDLEQSDGINWVFLPAGIRLLATLLFGVAGFEGLLLAGLYLNFQHFDFHNDFRSWSGAIAGALGPYLAYLFAKHWFNLKPRLEGLTVPRLLFTGVLCGLMSPAFHHAFIWVQTGHVDWPALAVMMIGDIVGILIVLGMVKGLMALARRYAPVASPRIAGLPEPRSVIGWFGKQSTVCFDWMHGSNIAGQAATRHRQACTRLSTCLLRTTTMRSYPSDSPQAVSRLLALTVISDGGGSPSEIAATYRLSILDDAGIEEGLFDQVISELTADLPTTPDGLVKVQTEMIDQCLGEIVRPELRLRVWKAMWQLAYADDHFAHAEVALLHRATETWGIEADADGHAQLVSSKIT